MAVFLLNGIDTCFGAQVAQALRNQAGIDLIGLGRSAPIASVGQATVLTGKFSGSQLAQVLQEKQVETVIHLAMAGEEQPNTDNEATLQQNVLESMLLLGACLTAKVKRVIIRSSTLIYGASVTNPVFIPEKQARSCSLKPGLIREYADLDTFAANFALKHPQIELVLLRCASLVGGGISSPLTRYLTQRCPRFLLGFNPRIQVLHPEDAAKAFALAATSKKVSGAFNLVADQPVPLKQAIRLAGNLPLPLPSSLLATANILGQRRAVLGHWPFEQAFLRYSCIADPQKAQRELGWQATYSATAILRTLGRSKASLLNP